MKIEPGDVVMSMTPGEESVAGIVRLANDYNQVIIESAGGWFWALERDELVLVAKAVK
jgi:dethiobiotin synthetase